MAWACCLRRMNSQEDVDNLRSIPEPQTVMGNELRKPGVAWGWGESLSEQRRLRGPLKWAASECLGSDDRWGGAWPGVGGVGVPRLQLSCRAVLTLGGVPERKEILREHPWGKRGAGLPGNSVRKGTCLPPGWTGLARVPQPDSSAADMGTGHPPCGPSCVWQGAEQCPFTRKILAAPAPCTATTKDVC